MADKRIDQLTEATSLTAVDLMVTEQSGVAKKVTGDILANSAWNMMQKDASPTKDSTAPVTSGAVYDALGGVFSPTKLATPGALVHIEDGGYNQPVQGMRIAVNPVQNGTGEPSPDNVRPISGWTSAKITRMGSNLVSPFAGDYTSTAKGITVTFSPTNVSITGTSTGDNADSGNMPLESPVTLRAGHTYVFAISGTWSTPSLRLFLRTATNGNLWYGDSTNCRWTVTPTADIEVYRIMFRARSSGSTFNVSGAFYANLNALGAYEPYRGEVYSVQLGQTNYGGTLTYNGDGTWTLMVDRAKHVVNGTETQVANQAMNAAVYRTGIQIADFVPNAIGAAAAQVLCNIGRGSTLILGSSASVGDCCLYTVGGIACVLIGVPIAYNTPATAKQWLIDNGCEFVAKLATPLTYTLTGPEVLTLLGINNIWADTGDIEELAYRADIGLYLVEALNPIKEMLANREDTMKATRAYSAGDFIVVGDTFYKAAVPIANGATLTPNTNVIKTTVGDQLKALS